VVMACIEQFIPPPLSELVAQWWWWWFGPSGSPVLCLAKQRGS